MLDRLRAVLTQRVATALLVALAMLVLYGAVPEQKIAVVLLAFVAARGLVLGAEALRRPRTAADWAALSASLLQHYGTAPREAVERDARAQALPLSASSSDVAAAALAAAQRAYVPPRSRGALTCEAVGLLTFGVLIPADAVLYTREFVSWRASQEWLGVGVVALAVALYAWPLLWPGTARADRRRALWWTLPFVPALALLCLGIAVRHPYLNPLRADRAKLAAERVLALEDNIVSGQHADWVFAYADEVRRGGDSTKAIELYRQGLRLRPGDEAAQALLEGLTQKGAPLQIDDGVRQAVARSPLLMDGEPVAPRTRCAIDAKLGEIDRTVIVIVPIGELPDGLADTVGMVIERELSVPTCVATNPVSLPPHTRTRGLVFGQQWNRQAMLQAFHAHTRPLPVSPAKYLLLTAADIYSDSSNFVFSSSYSWGALVSCARFGDLEVAPAEVFARTAKQSLGALVKTFQVPMSSDRNCVTSYSAGLEEFDAKGNRPNPESLLLFQRNLRARDRGWVAHRSASAQSPPSP